MIDITNVLRAEREKNEKGFTLIELMIVVAIIGILAAIAIPQFAAYRVKAFNSAAQSDLRNLKLAEEALYADFQAYGSTVVATTTAGAVAGEELTTVGFVATTGNAAATPEETSVGISTNVGISAKIDANGVSFTATAGHLQGNRDFGIDSDTTTLQWLAKAEGTAHVLATTPASTVNNDDIPAAWTVL